MPDLAIRPQGEGLGGRENPNVKAQSSNVRLRRIRLRREMTNAKKTQNPKLCNLDFDIWNSLSTPFTKYFVDATQFCIIMGLLYGHRILLQKVNLARLGCKSAIVRAD